MEDIFMGKEIRDYLDPRDTVFVFYVDGFAPELMPGFAFRLDKHFKAKGMKLLRCPYCGEIFKQVDSDVKVRVLSFKRGIAPDHLPSVQCDICNNPVGIINL